ncbi:MAG TPA: FtsX-like permease family protein [Blastocatellia bacterium]|nr:FtsX-like permease family protein [Blastocatellia bacterium]
MVRSELPPATVAAGLKRELTAIAPNWPVFEIKSLADSVSIQVFLPRLAAGILGALGLLGLLLALVGIYGLVSYSVTQRTHEIGIRIALGARSPQVLRLLMSQSIALTLVGIVAGGAMAVVTTRFLATLLIGISSTDPLTFALVPLALLSATTLASVIPARRALKVDPVEALRHE